MTLAHALFVLRLVKVEYKLLRWLWAIIDRAYERSHGFRWS